MTVVVPARIEAEGIVLQKPIRIELENVKSDKWGKKMFVFFIHVFSTNFNAIGAQLKLQNKFSVGLQTLPISGKKFVKNQASRFHSKMLEVKKYSDLLRSSPDYYVNWIWIELHKMPNMSFGLDNN